MLRRLAVPDWVLIGGLLPILVFGVVMSIVHGLRGSFVFPPFLVSSAPDRDSAPIVRELFVSPGQEGGAIAVGDRIARLDGVDLRGATTAAVALIWTAAARNGARSVLLGVDRGDMHFEARVPLIPGTLFPWVPWWAPLPLIVSLLGTGLLLIVRVGRWPLARRSCATCMLMAFTFTPWFYVPIMPRVGIASTVLGLPALGGLTLWTVAELIPGARLWGPRIGAFTCLLTVVLAASYASMFWLPDAGLGAALYRSSGLASTAIALTALVMITLAYRRSDALGRRQLKWIVYGFYVAMVPTAVFLVAYGLHIRFGWVGVLATVADVALAAAPLGFLVAVGFYDFLDVDRLFGATLSYSLLAIVGLAIVLSILPTAARAASDTLGLDPTTGQAFLSLALAAVLVPAQRVVRPRVDRLLFPERIALHEGFERLLADISGITGMQQLTRLLDERLDALLRPASIIVYARTADAFVPVAVRGRPAPPAFASGSSLIVTLADCTTPLAAERWTVRRAASLAPFERAAIETLDVAVIIPIRRGRELVAFCCLGAKRSSDIYSPTDLAMLSALAGRVSDRLLALDATAVAEQARVMQEALRRFVPDAVAERIVAGRDLESGEHEVTVLFVDIRGYTSFSESRDADEIFHTVNRYTETVSTIVQTRGGVVVQFQGDGLLAVFGAPGELPMKERAAVQASRDIVAAVSKLRVDGTRLSVGVGIATGGAFLGSIQSADRAIWTVIGNPVNLAARLQGLTRELDAAIAIDDTTFRRAAQTCAEFVSRGALSIRGRADSEVVYALPLAPDQHPGR